MAATTVDEAAIKGIEIYLKQAMGLNVASVGHAVILRAVQARMKALEMTTISAYINLMHTSEEEAKQLIEQVVIPETWFFRDKTPFEALQQYYKNEWLPDNKNRKFNMLSIPCSTGEEPYTMAMSLMDIGVELNLLRIDAIDISFNNIEKAKIGMYSKNSFRGENTEFQRRYFTTDGQYSKINEEIKKTVHFSQNNLLSPSFKPRSSSYDVIFCRNLLIYFDKATQDKTIDTLNLLLHKKGILFVGHAETGALNPYLFASAKYSHAFAFRKKDDDRRKKQNRPKISVKSFNKQNHEQRKSKFQSKMFEKIKPIEKDRTTEPNTIQNEQPTQSTQPTLLDNAFELANNGHLAEAADVCEQFIKQSGPNKQAYYLLGLIREAVGNRDQACTYLRKAIYLDPYHHDALIHLSSIMEKEGNSKEAKALKERALRVQNRTEQQLS